MNHRFRLASFTLLLVCALLLPACKSQKPTDMPRNKTSRLSDRPFVPGPSLEDPDQVLDWITALKPLPNGSKRRIRMPILVERGAPLSGEQTRYIVGVQGDLEPADRLELRLDDTGLGIPLSDRIRQFCRSEEAPCIIVVEGTWGPLIDLPGQDYAHTIALIHVLEFQGEASKGNAAFHVSAEE